VTKVTAWHAALVYSAVAFIDEKSRSRVAKLDAYRLNLNT